MKRSTPNPRQEEQDVLIEILNEKKSRKYGNNLGLWQTIGNEILHRLPAVPFPLFMSVFLGVITLTTCILMGVIILNSGQSRAVDFAKEYMQRNLYSVISSLQFRIDTAEQLIRIQRQSWENGEWGDSSPALYNYTMLHMFATIKSFKGLASTYQYISFTGGKHGYYYNVSDPETPVLNVWKTDAQHKFTSSIVDLKTGLPTSTYATTNNYSASDETFYRVAMPPRYHAPPIWTKHYGLTKNALWQTLAYALFNPQKDFVGIAGCKIDLKFISNILSEKVDEFHAKLTPPPPQSLQENLVEYYVFDMLSESILGSSFIDSVITEVDVDGTIRSLNLSELANIDTRLGLIFQHLRSSNAKLSGTQDYSFSVPGYYIETSSVRSTFPSSNLRWVLIQVVSENVLEDKLFPASGFNYLVNVILLVSSLVLGLLVSWKPTRQLKSLTSAVHSLSQSDGDRALQVLKKYNRGGISTSQIWNLQESIARYIKSKPPE